MSSSFLNIPDRGAATWKSSVDNAAALPLQGNTPGDARVSLSDNTIWIWGYDDAWHQDADGNVNGPATSVANDIAVFTDTTGAEIKDSGVNLTYNNTPTDASYTFTVPEVIGSTSHAPDIKITSPSKTSGSARAGSITLTTGSSSVASGAGNINLVGGDAGTLGNGGQILIFGGTGPSSSENIGGSVVVQAGAANSVGGGGGGGINLIGGTTSGINTNPSGGIGIRSGGSSSSGASAGTGAVSIQSGTVTVSTSANSGDINLLTGGVKGGNTGAINLTTNGTNSTTGSTGAITLTSGNMTQASSSANCGDINLNAGNNSGTGAGGKIILSEGTAPSGTQGYVQIGRNFQMAQHMLNTAYTIDGSSMGTLTNVPGSGGDPSGFIIITINGVTSYIPYWQ